MARKLHYTVDPGGLSPEHHERIFALADKGLSSYRIAREIRKHPGTVGWFMYQNGLKKRGPLKIKTYFRKGQVVHTFMPDEDAFIQDQRLQGLPYSAIARGFSARFGYERSRHSIQVRLVLLASYESASEGASVTISRFVPAGALA